MKLKRKVPDQMSLFLAGLDKEITFYLKCLGKPLRSFKQGKLRSIYIKITFAPVWRMEPQNDGEQGESMECHLARLVL